MKATAWNEYRILDGVESGRIVCATEHDTDTVTAALNEAEAYAQAWNAKESRPDMLVTMLSCKGYVRTVPTQGVLMW